jgi:hypothetical protein
MGAVLLAALLVTELVAIPGPSAQVIWINPSMVISIRAPRTETGHFPPGTRCLIGTSDGKFLMSSWPCEQVKHTLSHP